MSKKYKHIASSINDDDDDGKGDGDDLREVKLSNSEDKSVLEPLLDEQTTLEELDQNVGMSSASRDASSASKHALSASRDVSSASIDGRDVSSASKDALSASIDASSGSRDASSAGSTGSRDASSASRDASSASKDASSANKDASSASKDASSASRDHSEMRQNPSPKSVSSRRMSEVAADSDKLLSSSSSPDKRKKTQAEHYRFMVKHSIAPRRRRYVSEPSQNSEESYEMLECFQSIDRPTLPDATTSASPGPEKSDNGPVMAAEPSDHRDFKMEYITKSSASDELDDCGSLDNGDIRARESNHGNESSVETDDGDESGRKLEKRRVSFATILDDGDAQLEQLGKVNTVGSMNGLTQGEENQVALLRKRRKGVGWGDVDYSKMKEMMNDVSKVTDGVGGAGICLQNRGEGLKKCPPPKEVSSDIYCATHHIKLDTIFMPSQSIPTLVKLTPPWGNYQTSI